MKIIETTKEFKPVTVVFESAAELQYVTKMLGLGRCDIGKVFTDDYDFDPYSMYDALSDKCQDLESDTNDNDLFFIEKRKV